MADHIKPRERIELGGGVIAVLPYPSVRPCLPILIYLSLVAVAIDSIIASEVYCVIIHLSYNLLRGFLDAGTARMHVHLSYSRQSSAHLP